MFPIEVTGDFTINDAVPNETEIRDAVGKAHRGRACGPSRLRVEVIKEWLQTQRIMEERQNPEDCEEWMQFGDLVRHIFRTGEVPQAFSLGTLVLVPKQEQGKCRGIALLEPIYKIIGTIIATRINDKVKFNDSVHGFRSERGCATAIIENKLSMELARKEGYAYHQIFLDLSKAYDTVDQDQLFQILEGYGVGPNVCTVLRTAWRRSRLIPKKAGYYGPAIARSRGVPQGDPLSPTLFNLVIDAVVRHVATTMAHREDGVKMAFYADDGQIGGKDAEGIQLRLTLMTDLFARMGLQMNSRKTVAMTSKPHLRATSQQFGARRRRQTEEEAQYEARSKEEITCPHCPKKMQKRNLVRHIRTYHPEVEDPQHPDLYSPPPNPPPDQVWRFSQPNNVEITCPYPLCPNNKIKLRDRAATFKHWVQVHPEAPIIIEEAAGFQQCPRCLRMLSSVNQRHLSSAACKEGNRRRRARALEQDLANANPDFHVAGDNLDRVRRFQYLGRILSDDCSDLQAVVRNIDRARANWGQISRVLASDGVTIHLYSRFYLVVVSTVLLYGAGTWSMTNHMWSLLNGFHNRCARHITRRYIKKNPATQEWTTPDSKETLRLAFLQPIKYYVQNRRNHLYENYTGDREVFHQCEETTPGLTHSFACYWTQDFHAVEPLPIGDLDPNPDLELR